jgi:hypothetical protein
MSKTAVIEFKRNDGVTHTLKIPLTSWSAGGTLYFTAKPAVDNDATDATAVIDKSFTDASVTTDGVYAIYTLAFDGAVDITNVNFQSGETRKEYLGEFQYTPLVGKPISFPANDNYIEVIIYADIKVGTT